MQTDANWAIFDSKLPIVNLFLDTIQLFRHIRFNEAKENQVYSFLTFGFNPFNVNAN